MQGAFNTLLVVLLSAHASSSTVWVAGGGAELAYSSDGIAWTASAHPFATGVYGVVACDGIWVAVGAGATDSIARSTDDGVSFTGLGLIGGNKGIACTTTLSTTRWVAIGNSGSKIAVSTDGGATWTGQNPSQITIGSGIAFSPSQGRWVLCGNDANGAVFGVSTDSTATGWTFFSTLDASSFFKPRIVFNAGRWVVTGSALNPRGTYYSTDNGVSWTFEEFGGAIPTNFIVFDAHATNGQFVLAGKFGTIPPIISVVVYSPTGAGGTWLDSGYLSPTNVSVVVAIAYSPSQSLWLSVSPNAVATSPDAITWTGPLSSPLTSAPPTAVICAFDSFGGGTSAPTGAPTESPTSSPTESPTESPTASPTESPTSSPTGAPTESPTLSPTASPTGSPTESPTASPTSSPTGAPTESPTFSPTASPTSSPTVSPTSSPTGPIVLFSSNGTFIDGDAIVLSSITLLGNTTVNGTLSINASVALLNHVTLETTSVLIIGAGSLFILLVDPDTVNVGDNITVTLIYDSLSLEGQLQVRSSVRSTDVCTVLSNDEPYVSVGQGALTITTTLLGTTNGDGCSPSSPLSVGLIVGIALACIVGGALVAWLVLVFYRRERARTTALIRQNAHSQMAHVSM